MAKYDRNQVCGHCQPYVDGYVNAREGEIVKYVETVKPAVTMYNHLVTKPEAEDAFQHVQASMSGQAWQPSAGKAKGGSGDAEESDPIRDEIDEIKFDLHMDKLRANPKYAHLQEDDWNSIIKAYERPEFRKVPPESVGWAVLQGKMNAPAGGKRETASAYAPPSGEAPEHEEPRRSRSNDPMVARREIDAGIDRDFEEALGITRPSGG